MKTRYWTVDDLAHLPNDEGKRYEIIDGELYVSTQPDWQHQLVCVRLVAALETWSDQTQAGTANFAPGVIFTKENAVAPDVVWISNERLTTALQADGKLHASPELMIEVPSPGSTNARRDRQLKLALYSHYGTEEYWIVTWQERRVEVYRRKDDVLVLHECLSEGDILQSPLLPGFSCKVERLFTRIPR
ncbi:MAG: Uma2 family endonuclease [Ktedonobacteraceae bacterium]